jgi:streptogramin lyase
MIPLPSPSARAVVIDFGSIWIAGTREVELYRIDPATSQIVATIDLHSRPTTLTSGEGSVWVRQQDGTVQRIDGRTAKLLATIATEAADNYGDIVVAGGFVWTSSQTVPLVQIDPQTNSRRPRFSSPPGAFMGYSVAYGGGSLWLGGSALFRVKPPE